MTDSNFQSNFYQRYHQDHQQDVFLGGFSRLLIEKESERKILGVKVEITHFAFGGKIYRMSLLGRLFEFWKIPKKSQYTFGALNKEFIRKPISLEISLDKFKSEPTLFNRLNYYARQRLYWLHTKLLPKSISYSTIYENYGEHDVEGKLYVHPRFLLFIRNKYLIKLAMDLKLLKGRELAKQKQEDIGRPINSFNLVMAKGEDGELIDNFDLVKYGHTDKVVKQSDNSNK